MAPERTRRAATERAGEGAPGAPKVRWDDSRMQSAYANVCNVASTREEVVLLFGVNQAWQAGQAEIPIQLTSRLILSPFAAKRLALLLDNVLKEYETRFGALPAPGAPRGKSPGLSPDLPAPAVLSAPRLPHPLPLREGPGLRRCGSSPSSGPAGPSGRPAPAP